MYLNCDLAKNHPIYMEMQLATNCIKFFGIIKSEICILHNSDLDAGVYGACFGNITLNGVTQ